MRKAFAEEITKIASQRKDIILMSGDIGNKMFEDFKKVAQNRFLNCGIAEASMTSIAAGIALNNLRPIIYTISFNLMRRSCCSPNKVFRKFHII